MPPKHPVKEIRFIADKIIELLGDTAERAEYAGSLRRNIAAGENAVLRHDFELIVTPKINRVTARDIFTGQDKLLEEKNLLLPRLRQLRKEGILQERLNIKNELIAGLDRNQAEWVALLVPMSPREWFAMDLFIYPPELFGWHWILRTGPDSFNKAMLSRRFRPPDLIVEGGEIKQAGQVLQCYSEEEVFRHFHLAYIEPHKRNLAGLMAARERFHNL